MADDVVWFLGIDWGGETHHVCLLDRHGEVCGAREVAQTAAGIHDALLWVRTQTDADPAAMAVGIETPRGC